MQITSAGILYCAFAAIGLAILMAPLAGTAQGSSDFERRRAQMRADFERMRSEHAKSYSPAGQAHVRQMQEHSRKREEDRQAAARAQIHAAAAMKVSPSACAMAYEQALHDAKRYEQIRPFFSQHYYNVYMNRKSAQEQQDELTRMKHDYVFEGKVRGKDKIESDGHADVWLEGLDASGKGCWVNLRMIPESNYWKIDGYRGQTGLNVIRIPANPGLNISYPKK